jgi:Na+/proline symporter
MVQAWAGLLHQEWALAQRSLRWCLIGAIALPVAALGVWLGLSTLLIAAAYTWSNNWMVALLFGTGVQVLVFALLLRQLRRWGRDLTLPQSRAALVHAMERMK